MRNKMKNTEMLKHEQLEFALQKSILKLQTFLWKSQNVNYIQKIH